MHAPQGVGALYVRKGTRSSHCFMEDVTSARGARGRKMCRASWRLGKAAELARRSLSSGDDRTIAAMRDRLRAGNSGRIEGTTV